MYPIVRLMAVKQSARDDGRVKFRVYDQKRSRLSWVLASPLLRRLCPTTVMVLYQSLDDDPWSV